MRVKLSLMFLLFAFAYAGLGTVASAQCAVCAISEGCFECQQGPEGGTSCFTQGCFRCRTVGVCPAFGLAAQSNLPKASLKVDRDTVRQIATIAPRLAVILSDLGREQTLKESYTFYLADVQVNAEDLDWLLNPNDQSSASLARQRKEAARLKGKPAVLYDVSLQADPHSSLGTLTIQLRNSSASDSSGSLLQVTLLEDARKANVDKRRWTVQSWQVR